MTFSYNNGVPAANNNPSVDQPDMLINAQSIASLVAVDHVGFNATGGGRHNQVTFNANNVPSIPTSPPVLFTNTAAGLPQLFFYSGPDAAHTSSQYVIAANGSTFLLAGIIMKWGSFTLLGGQVFGVTFATAFPNNVWNITVQSKNRVADSTVTLISTAGFTATNPVGTSVDYYYFAIGN